MNFPTNVKYTNEHEWIRLEGDEAYVGITDYAQEQLGDIVFVDVTTEGFLPIGGEVLEINPELEEHPELVNKDPYGDGWLIKIKPTDTTEMDELLDAEAYKQIINE